MVLPRCIGFLLVSGMFSMGLYTRPAWGHVRNVNKTRRDHVNDLALNFNRKLLHEVEVLESNSYFLKNVIVVHSSTRAGVDGVPILKSVIGYAKQNQVGDGSRVGHALRTAVRFLQSEGYRSWPEHLLPLLDEFRELPQPETRSALQEMLSDEAAKAANDVAETIERFQAAANSDKVYANDATLRAVLGASFGDWGGGSGRDYHRATVRAAQSTLVNPGLNWLAIQLPTILSEPLVKLQEVVSQLELRAFKLASGSQE